jgi:hypothetical protein
MRIAGINSEIVSASAVARLGNGPGCLYALGPDISYNGTSGSADLILDANYLNATGCAVMSGATIGSTGPSHEANASMGDATGTCDACFNFIPSTVQTIAPPPDPLAYLQSNIPTPQTPAASCPPYNYCPGSYPNGINLTGNNLAASFSPGTYVLGSPNCTQPCGLTINGTGTVTGNGVTFYNSGASAISINAPGTPYVSCTNSDVTVQLVAPSAPGIYSGILFFQDVNDTQQMVLQMSNGTTCGGGGPSIANAAATASYALGAVYAPGATAEIMGLSPSYGYCSYIPRYTLVVALDIILGGADVNVNMDDCDGTTYPNPSNPVPNGPILPPDPIKAAVLVE